MLSGNNQNIQISIFTPAEPPLSYKDTLKMYKEYMVFRRLMLNIFGILLFGYINAQNKSALLVGISEYPQSGQSSWGTIHGSNDVELIMPFLSERGFLIDSLCNQAATASNIRTAINNIIKTSKLNDIIYLHFSCHGQPFEDMDDDEEDGWDESIVPYDAQMIYKKDIYEGQNHITDDELNIYLNKLRAIVGPEGYVLVVFDACHSGGSSRGDEFSDEEDDIYIRGTNVGFTIHEKDYRPRINAQSNYQIKTENEYANITILEACRSYQSNHEIKQDGKYYGPLSYYISQVLAKQIDLCSLEWILEVKSLMNSDGRLIRQNMVYETSLK